jgi:hypothetical protein
MDEDKLHNNDIGYTIQYIWTGAFGTFHAAY